MSVSTIFIGTSTSTNTILVLVAIIFSQMAQIVSSRSTQYTLICSTGPPVSVYYDEQGRLKLLHGGDDDNNNNNDNNDITENILTGSIPPERQRQRQRQRNLRINHVKHNELETTTMLSQTTWMMPSIPISMTAVSSPISMRLPAHKQRSLQEQQQLQFENEKERRNEVTTTSTENNRKLHMNSDNNDDNDDNNNNIVVRMKEDIWTFEVRPCFCHPDTLRPTIYDTGRFTNLDENDDENENSNNDRRRKGRFLEDENENDENEESTNTMMMMMCPVETDYCGIPSGKNKSEMMPIDCFDISTMEVIARNVWPLILLLYLVLCLLCVATVRGVSACGYLQNNPTLLRWSQKSCCRRSNSNIERNNDGDGDNDGDNEVGGTTDMNTTSTTTPSTAVVTGTSTNTTTTTNTPISNPTDNTITTPNERRVREIWDTQGPERPDVPRWYIWTWQRYRLESSVYSNVTWFLQTSWTSGRLANPTTTTTTTRKAFTLKTKRFQQGQDADSNHDHNHEEEEDDEEEDYNRPTCTICFVPFEEGDILGKLNCPHDFHKDCLKTWIQRKNACPLCHETLALLSSSS